MTKQTEHRSLLKNPREKEQVKEISRRKRKKRGKVSNSGGLKISIRARKKFQSSKILNPA